MARPEKKTRVGVTLLGPDIRLQSRTAYLYRTNARKEPIGSHLLKTAQEIDLESVRNRFGPGLYYVMETGGEDEEGNALPLATRVIFIEPVETKPPAIAGDPSPDDSSFFREMQQLYKLRFLERESRGEPSIIEILKAVRELTPPPGQNDAILQAFLQGAQWQEPEGAGSGGDPIGDAISKLVESQTGKPDPRTQRLAALYARKVQLLQKKIADLEAEKTALSVRVHNAEAEPVDGAGDTPDGILETIAEALQTIAHSGAPNLTQALVEIAASAPPVLDQLDALGPDERERILADALGRAGRPDLIEPYRDSLETYLERFRTARRPTAPRGRREQDEPEPMDGPA